MLRVNWGKGNIRSLLLGIFIITLLTATSLLAPFVTMRNPFDQNLSASLQGPGQNGIFGTDSLGRDVYSRVIYGARISLAVGVGVLSFALLLGTVLGTAAGYFGGAVDSFIMRVADVIMSFPPLVLAMIAMAFIGPGLGNLIAILVIIRWPQFARLVRGQVISVKNRSYVDAARVSGTSSSAIVLRHILPNSYAPVIATATMSIGSIIIDETALSFLGLGIEPPIPTWGSMLADAKNYISIAPWLVIFPGLAILITVLGFNLLGDGLGYLLNPKQVKQRGVSNGDIAG